MKQQTKGKRDWATIKVRPETKRLLDLIVAAEQTTHTELQHELAQERWKRVLEAGLLPK